MHRLAIAALAALFTAVLPAQQLWFAQNDNTTYTNLAVGWPAAVLAFRFTAPQTDVIDAAQVFTGNAAPAPHTLEVRAHDPVTGLPGALVGASGTWTTVHTRCWQGARLGAPAAVVGGQDYWLVWRVTGMFHQHSVAADSPTNTLSEVRISDGTTYHAQAFLAAKFRLFTAHAAGAITAFGTGKSGTHGEPTIGISGWPAVGSVIDVWLDNAVRRQPALLAIGDPVPTGIPLGFATLYMTFLDSLMLTTVTQSSPFVGGATVSFMVPNDPGLAGLTAAFQCAVLDPLAADGIAHTAAAQLTLQ